jgi:hypothetical protein
MVSVLNYYSFKGIISQYGLLDIYLYIYNVVDIASSYFFLILKMFYI